MPRLLKTCKRIFLLRIGLYIHDSKAISILTKIKYDSTHLTIYKISNIRKNKVLKPIFFDDCGKIKLYYSKILENESQVRIVFQYDNKKREYLIGFITNSNRMGFIVSYKFIYNVLRKFYYNWQFVHIGRDNNIYDSRFIKNYYRL